MPYADHPDRAPLNTRGTNKHLGLPSPELLLPNGETRYRVYDH